MGNADADWGIRFRAAGKPPVRNTATRRDADETGGCNESLREVSPPTTIDKNERSKLPLERDTTHEDEFNLDATKDELPQLKSEFAHLQQSRSAAVPQNIAQIVDKRAWSGDRS